MRPLAPVAAGMVIVAIDVRTEVLDLVADPIGWALVAAGAALLASRAATVAALAAAVLSLSDVHLPYRYLAVNPRTGELVEPGAGAGSSRHLAFNDLSGVRLWLVVAAAVAGAAAVWFLTSELLGRARGAGDAAATRQLAVLHRLAPLAWAAPTIVLAAVHAEAYDPIWNGHQELLALAGIGSVLWLAVVAVWRSGARWALPPSAPLRPLTPG